MIFYWTNKWYLECIQTKCFPKYVVCKLFIGEIIIVLKMNYLIEIEIPFHFCNQLLKQPVIVSDYLEVKSQTVRVHMILLASICQNIHGSFEGKTSCLDVRRVSKLMFTCNFKCHVDVRMRKLHNLKQ